jgi:predicted metalloendopeptidase
MAQPRRLSQYIAGLLTAAGIPDAPARAQRVYDLEMKIAGAHASRGRATTGRSPSAVDPADFASKAPGLDWSASFDCRPARQPARSSPPTIRAQSQARALVGSEAARRVEGLADFHQITRTPRCCRADRPAQLRLQRHPADRRRGAAPAREARARAVNAGVGDALGKLYTDAFFPASAKAAIEEMVDNIKAAFVSRIDAIEWMAPETKAEAKHKVETMEVGVGYPDTWRDYSSLEVAADTAYANKQAAEKLRYTQQLAKIGKPLDKREWWMNAQLVNAVNLPVQNALNFPAGILQPPFFDPAPTRRTTTARSAR